MEELILDYLRNEGLNPFSVLHFELEGIELIKVSFYIESDLDRLENLLDYHYSSDKSGLIIFNSTHTVLIKGFILDKLIKKVFGWKSIN